MSGKIHTKKWNEWENKIAVEAYYGFKRRRYERRDPMLWQNAIDEKKKQEQAAKS